MKTKLFIASILSFCWVTLLSAQPLAKLANDSKVTSSVNIPQQQVFSSNTPPIAPGWVNQDDILNTCFSYMGKIDFSSTWRFKADDVNGDASTKRQYGFSIPLVGDLDGDGFPEIVSIGTATAELHGLFSHLDIYNGQTGKRLAHLRLDLKTTGIPGYAFSSNYHGSPSIMAMANVAPERDDDVDVIMAFPGSTGYSFPFANKVVSYRMKKLASPDLEGNHYSLEKNWESTNTYNSEAGLQSAYTPWHRAIPQIVDIDGDGVPEVIVYNKIYNAVTGNLLVKMEDLGSTANVGAISWGPDVRGDRGIGFSYAYDLDLDGSYDIAAGGKVYYDINTATGSYKVQSISGVADGRTGVADVNGDSIPDVVVVDRTSDTRIVISIWDPGFLHIDSQGRVVRNTTPTAPKLIAQKVLTWDDNVWDQGTHSYVYIGDIDGLEQEYNGKVFRLPEIAILSGNIQYDSVKQHPNVIGKGIPTSGWSNTGTSYTGQYGVIGAFTFDPSDSELKMSFVLGHKDRSINTGFTMFDFDNDGTQEICYRDEKSLRIIKASSPFVRDDSNDSNIILFDEPCSSFTGFEYPVIADIDNDASAEMIVIGQQNMITDQGWGYVYAVGNGTKDKFAPALNVWNQFMYDPFKINPDLTIPTGPAVNRLDPSYSFTKVIRNKDTDFIEKVIENYNPYNGTLIQASKFMLYKDEVNGIEYDNLFEPLVFLNEAYFVLPNQNDPSKNPKIVSAGGNHYIEVYIGNKNTAQTSLSINTPISIYNHEVSEANFYKKVTLGEIGVLESIKAGEEIVIRIPVSSPYGFYVLRLGDSSDFSVSGSPVWKWGINVPGYNDLVNCVGTSARANRDCNWTDQLINVSKFALFDDALTLQEFGTITTNILNNDILPDDFKANFADAIITHKPQFGKLSFSGEDRDGNIAYEHFGSPTPNNVIDRFTYQLSYLDKTTSPHSTITLEADVYLYILRSKHGLAACAGEDFTIDLISEPIETNFYWYEMDGITEVGTNPQSEIVIPSIDTSVSYKIKPIVSPTNTTYGNINFPLGNLTVQVTPASVSTLTWTGEVSNSWHNPANWIDNLGTSTYGPTGCVNAIIPKMPTDKQYPELVSTGAVSSLTLEDRAMIKNSHLVTADKIEWKLTIKPNEFNRWLSLSAPITHIYSGDYIIFDGNNRIKDASYISFFNADSPDGESIASSNNLTRPFGKIEEQLPLGKPYMLYLDKTKINTTNPSLIFPRQRYQYDYKMNSVQGMAERTKSSEQLDRAANNNEQFLFTTASNYNAADGSFEISYIGEYILVTNPFPAMLDLTKFLADNNTVLDMEYKVWDGTKNDNFIELKSENGNAPTWVINKTANMISVSPISSVYIAPFQSFFVKRLDGSTSQIQLKFNPNQTDIMTIDYEY